MLSLKPVVGLSGRHTQIAVDQFCVKGVQERSVMKQKSAFSLLRIAGALPAGHGQVAGIPALPTADSGATTDPSAKRERRAALFPTV